MLSSSELSVGIDHVGIAVESIDEAQPLLELLGTKRAPAREGSDGTFNWVHYDLPGGGRLELIEPVEGVESFLTDFLDERGPGLHHVTLEVADVDAAVELLESSGIRIVDRQTKGSLEVAYVSPRNPTGVLFQLIEWTEPRPTTG
jgi:methylmalonyl-CoA/ethylmalonyl-CoA epimerase